MTWITSRRRVARAHRAMRDATSYAEWLAAAEEHDHLTGLDAWREVDESRTYDAAELGRALATMAELRARGDVLALVDFLHESLYRHLGDLAAPALYRVAAAGTKRLVGRFIDEAVATMEWLAHTPFVAVPDAVKLREFERAARNFGRSALMLSGGAALGFIHFGVVKALLEADLLPQVISGASTGAMIAAGVCARTDDELREMFATRDLRLDGLAPTSPAVAWHQRALLDPARLYTVLRANIGEWTFAEAHARSGRILNISVSPTRVRQKPRLLTHLTAPDVLIASAALASSALPGLFPPVTLHARRRDGSVRDYVPHERWIDGTVAGDLPKRRLSRLHNVNHFVVSQVNPHVAPVARFSARDGVLPTVTGLVATGVRNQAAQAADLLRLVAGSGALRLATDTTHSLLSQEYGGDIDIHPRLHPTRLARIFANPSPEDLDWFILEGQRATWPRLAEIRDQTRIARTFDRCLAALRGGRQVPG